MITYNYLPLTFDEMPVQKTFTFGDVAYVFEFYYNSRNDFFTCYIKTEDDEILYSCRLVYGNTLYHAVVDGLELNANIIPFDIQDLLTEFAIDNDTVNSENLDNPVRLYIVE